MFVFITLTSAGADAGPFNLYSNVDGFVSAFAVNIPKATLLAGYAATVPAGSALNASSVGAKTVIGSSVFNAPSRPAARTAASSVLWFGEF